MKRKTYLHNTLNIADDKAKYDQYAKNILKDAGILSYILKYAVKEFADYTLDEAKAAIDGTPEVSVRKIRPGAVRTLENESEIPDEGKMYFDIIFCARTKNGDRQKIYINLEAQKSFYPGYDLVTRGIIYPARLISKQMDVEYTANDYSGVKKVYSIWICFNTPSKNRSYESVANSIVEYSITPKVLFPADSYVSNIATGRYDLMSTIFINLNAEKTVDSKNILISMLSTLFSNNLKVVEKEKILEEKYNIEMSEELMKGVAEMCNLGEGIAEAAIEQGLEKGMQQGMQQGKIEATIRTAKKFGVNDDNIIQTLMEECSLSEAEAIKELEKYSE